jgi:hypothetical protein
MIKHERQTPPTAGSMQKLWAAGRCESSGPTSSHDSTPQRRIQTSPSHLITHVCAANNPFFHLVASCASAVRGRRTQSSLPPCPALRSAVPQRPSYDIATSGRQQGSSTCDSQHQPSRPRRRRPRRVDLTLSRTLIRKHVDAAKSLFALADAGIATVGACDGAASSTFSSMR